MILSEKFDKNQKILLALMNSKIKLEKIDLESIKKEIEKNKISSDHLQAIKNLAKKNYQ